MLRRSLKDRSTQPSCRGLSSSPLTALANPSQLASMLLLNLREVLGESSCGASSPSNSSKNCRGAGQRSTRPVRVYMHTHARTHTYNGRTTVQYTIAHVGFILWVPRPGLLLDRICTDARQERTNTECEGNSDQYLCSDRAASSAVPCKTEQKVSPSNLLRILYEKSSGYKISW